MYMYMYIYMILCEFHIYSLYSIELVLNIYIPTKQNNLKSGRAQLRIRNTGFTITTCDSPPRCQGTWQIIHIRKYGGSESFRFQTGMLSCMSQIHTDVNNTARLGIGNACAGCSLF